ncbi:MAG: S8/S53 family peptidase, partial [Phycisphaerales bacterium]
MGWQIRPDLSPAQMKELLFASVHVRESGAKIIHPAAFIGLVRKKNNNQLSKKQPQPSSGTLTIVPGVRVGKYTLDMSKDDLLKELGKPNNIHYGGEDYTLDNLPQRYFMFYDGISFFFNEEAIAGISTNRPRYQFANGLKVGDSQNRIVQTFGEDFRLMELKRMDVLIYEAKGLRFEIDKRTKTIEEISVNQVERHQNDSDALDSGKKIKLSIQQPGPIMFPKIDRRPKPEKWRRGEKKSLPKYNPDSTDPFQVDLRSYDLSKLDLRDSIEDLMYADFDHGTVWPTADRMPEGFDRERIMELGKNPGLGVRKVHERGITGRGIGIAIVDQPLLTKHQEYADRLRLYEEINVEPGSDPSMHGAAVASIALGKTVGVAPEADLYYIGSWTGDWGKGKDGFEWNFAYYAQAVCRILEINKQLPDDRKIRVISMSVGWSSKRKGYDQMTAAVEEAKKADMLVVCSCIDDVHGFVFDGLDRTPLSDPDDFASSEPGLWLAEGFYRGKRKWNQLWVPMGSRTTAAPNGIDEYVFYRMGGWSWAIPYVAGVYALAAQVDPEITP